MAKQDTELSLFIGLPGAEEPVCIAQSGVCWVAGRRFVVEMDIRELETQKAVAVPRVESRRPSIRQERLTARTQEERP